MSLAQFFDDFNNVSGCPTDCFGFIDEDNCLPDWISSHGTPRVGTANPFNGGGNSALQTTFLDAEGEGAIRLYDFQSGQTYMLSLANYTDPAGTDHDPVTLNLVLTNYMPHSVSAPNDCDAPLPNPPGPTQLIGQIHFAQTTPNWQFDTFCFTPQQNFTQLWIYPSVAPQDRNGNGGVIFTDNLGLEMCSEPKLSYQKQVIPAYPCPGDDLTLDWEICLDQDGCIGDGDLLLDITLLLPPYFSFAAGNGTAQITLAVGQCQTLSFPLHSDPQTPLLPLDFILEVKTDWGCNPDFTDRDTFSFNFSQSLPVADFTYELGAFRCGAREVCFTSLAQPAATIRTYF
ncbi:MAG: hypothetical protein D6765_09430 [Bacteroidetes bacterium]|nr:MAG: hypothetical protein D6765_09430 [Bacteroidota bacterium]